jgi:hypothetical protein
MSKPRAGLGLGFARLRETPRRAKAAAGRAGETRCAAAAQAARR